MSLWLRLYTDILNNEELQSIPAEMFRVWVNLLCVAKHKEGELPPIPKIAFLLRMSVDQCTQAIEFLEDSELIDRKGEVLKPHNWDRYQYVSDSSLERVKKHRMKQRMKRRSNGECNGDVTVQSRDRDRAETEKSKNSVGANGSPPPPNLIEKIIAEFQSMPAFVTINVRREYEKCDAWCKTNGKQNSKKRLLNWLNKSDLPLNGPVLKDEPYLPEFK